jgi:hypothetical protein
MIPNTNDGSSNAPALRCYLNLGTLGTLPDWSTAPKGDTATVLKAIKAAGYDGVQGGSIADVKAAGLGVATGDRVNKVGEIGPRAQKWKDEGYECATLHVAWGFEDDAAVDALVNDVIDTSVKTGFPLYIETHRATITNDPWRTIRIANRHPDVRFNGDFSHWYTGSELVYGGVDWKMDLMQPVFDRVRFVHGRIGNPGSMQVDIGDGTGRTYVDHFKQIWTRCFSGFLKSAKPGDYIVFAPELLHSLNYYARAFPGPDGKPKEESDRWEQALLYCKIARECFASARAQ